MTEDTPLASLARQYMEMATPEPEATDVVMEKAEVDLQIDTNVYEAALARAETQSRSVSAVTRAIIFTAAALAKPDPAYRSELTRPPLREYRQRDDRSRLRFKLPKIDYAAAQKAIRQSGKSMSEVVETGLRAYARTGEIPQEAISE